MTTLSVQKLEAAVITQAQMQSFLNDGFVHLPGVIDERELQALQEVSEKLIDSAVRGNLQDLDYKFSTATQSGARVFKRIDFVVDKDEAFRHLLAHPFILNSVEKLQGPNFIPTWDALVVKMPGESAAVPWHRDAAADFAPPHLPPVFNVDIYLDEAGPGNCLWVIPGSHQWGAEQAAKRVSKPGFETTDAVAVPVKAGDIVLHNIRLLHGSAPGKGGDLRRTVYYEFRPAETELAWGPHNEAYIPLKQQVLLECIAQRGGAFPGEGNEIFQYRPQGRFNILDAVPPKTFRYEHEKYWATAGA